jgi:hypothetical protein
MRDADVRTTMNQYGSAHTADMAEAHGGLCAWHGTAGKRQENLCNVLRSGERGRNRTFNLLIKS